MTARVGFALGLGGGLVVAAAAWLTRPLAPVPGHTHPDAALRAWGCDGCVALFRAGVRQELRALAQAAQTTTRSTAHPTPEAP